MENFKTIKVNDKILNPIYGELKFLSEKNEWMQKVEIWLLNDEINRNDWRYERLEEHKHLFADTPILVAYVGNKIGDGHNFKEVYNPDGTVTASFMDATAERIVGFFKSESDIRIVEKDNKKWIVGVGWIWQWYAQELVAKLKKQGFEGMSVSIETLINEMHKEGSTEVFTEYQILGTTILGDDVNPAVADANIRALSAIGVAEVKNMTLRVASEQQKQNKNPQTKINKEKIVTMKIKDLQEKVDGFKVLGIDGNRAALLSNEKGKAFMTTFEKENGEIIVGAKTAVNAVITLGEGENSMSVALDSVVDSYIAENAELKTKLSKQAEDYETIKTVLTKMQAQETERRKEAIKNTVKTRLDEIASTNSEIHIEDNLCNDLLSDEKINEYVSLEDANGKFIGEEKAICDVDNRCMSKILDEKKLKNSTNTVCEWDILKNDSNIKTFKDRADEAIKNILK